MPIDPQHLRDFAKDIAFSSASTEVQLRAAGSRAYYAAFHALLPFAERLPKSTLELKHEAAGKKGKGHIGHTELQCRIEEWKTGDLHPGFAQMKGTKGALVQALEAARANRELADYRLSDSFTRNEAEAQYYRVQKILRHALQIIGLLECATEGDQAGENTAAKAAES